MTADAAAVRSDPVHALIARGLEGGIITPDQATRLRALAGAEPSSGTGEPGADLPEDEERLRFITGFADIFVTLGLFLFLGAASYLGNLYLGRPAGFAAIAALAWVLAEFFSRRRRMALPSIVLLAVFAYCGFGAVSTALGDWEPSILGPLVGRTNGHIDPLVVASAAAATLMLAALHYWRFRVPITVAAGMGALFGTLVALALAALPDAGQATLNALLVLAGLASFVLAMRFDLSDPERVTRRADIAFWLHLLAAPLIVHPVLSTLVSATGTTVTPSTAAAVLAVVLFLSLVALVTDRRAILVSGLVYAGIAVGSLMREIGVTSVSWPLTVLLLGAFVLLLSAGWQPLRRLAVRLLPVGMRRRLPHPVAA